MSQLKEFQKHFQEKSPMKLVEGSQKKLKNPSITERFTEYITGGALEGN